MSKNSNHFFHFLLHAKPFDRPCEQFSQKSNRWSGGRGPAQHTDSDGSQNLRGGGTPGTLQLIPKLKGRSFCSLTWAIPISWIDLLLSPRPILLPLWAKMVARIVPTVHHALFCSMAPLWGLEPELDQQGHRKSPMSGSGMGGGGGQPHTPSAPPPPPPAAAAPPPPAPPPSPGPRRAAPPQSFPQGGPQGGNPH